MVTFERCCGVLPFLQTPQHCQVLFEQWGVARSWSPCCTANVPRLLRAVATLASSSNFRESSSISSYVASARSVSPWRCVSHPKPSVAFTRVDDAFRSPAARTCSSLLRSPRRSRLGRTRTATALRRIAAPNSPSPPLEYPPKRRSQVVEFLLQPLYPEPLLRSGQPRFGSFRQQPGRRWRVVPAPTRLLRSGPISPWRTGGWARESCSAPLPRWPLRPPRATYPPARRERSRTLYCSMPRPEHTCSAASSVHPPAKTASRPNNALSISPKRL